MVFDSYKLRQEFPILENRRDTIYFDNACTTLRPRCVIDAITSYYTDLSACHGRAQHTLAKKTTEAIAGARKALGDFIGSPSPNQVIFCRNTTDAINRVVFGFRWNEGDSVLTTDLEHNSNLLPWQFLAQRRMVRHILVPTYQNGTFDFPLFKTVLHDSKVRLVSTLWTSNVTGSDFPVHDIVEEAHRHGALVLLDAAQAVLTHPIDVQELQCDFLCFSAHKMFGPSGVGLLYLSDRALDILDPVFLGGDTVEDVEVTSYTLLSPPQSFEPGIQDYAGIIGFAEASRFLKRLGQYAVRDHVVALNRFATERLSQVAGVDVIGPVDPEKRGGILNLFVEGLDANTLARLLNDIAQIMVRAGRHCAHAYYNAHNLPDSVRFSFGPYNTLDEVGTMCEVFGTILKHYR